MSYKNQINDSTDDSGYDSSDQDNQVQNNNNNNENNDINFIDKYNKKLNKWYSILWIFTTCHTLFLVFAIQFSSLKSLRDTNISVQISWQFIIILISCGAMIHKHLKYTITLIPILFVIILTLALKFCALISQFIVCNESVCTEDSKLLFLLSMIILILVFCSIGLFISSIIIYRFENQLSRKFKSRFQRNPSISPNSYDPQVTKPLISGMTNLINNQVNNLLFEEKLNTNKIHEN